MRKRLRRSQPVVGFFWICFLAAAAFAYAMFQGGFVSWFLFYSVLPLWLYVIAISAFPMSSLEGEREISQEVFASGAAMRVQVTIRNRSWFPLFFLIVHDKLPERLEKNALGETKDYRTGSRALFFPGLKRQVQYTYTVKPMPRGEFELAEIKLKTGDIFGFIQKSFTLSCEQQILVYPRYDEIHFWEPPAHHDEGSRRSRKSLQYDITSVASVRDYTPGDRLSWLDWKSTARTNKLLTKEFERPLNEDFVVCVDRYARHYGKNDPVFERIITTAASVIRFALNHGSSVALVSFGREKTVIPFAGGTEQQWRIFYHLARTAPDGTVNDLPLLQQSFRRFPSRSNIVYITPVVDERLLQLVNSLISSMRKVTVFLVAEENEQPGAKPEDIQRVRHLGADVIVWNGRDLNEALKAGAHYATN
ncbi:MAG TPA: DUF58 domain-containing protein [Bacillales bacterium]|nr:DUF58 domain-containing protein [Bacillales bacterium]